MEEIKLSNEKFNNPKRVLKLGKLKPKPIILEVGKPALIKLNEKSDPIELYIDEICVSHEYPTMQVSVRFIDTKYIPKYYIRNDWRDTYEQYSNMRSL